MTTSGSTIDQVKDGVAAVLDRLRRVLDHFSPSGTLTGSVVATQLSPVPVRKKRDSWPGG
jgi:hypothetical protein